jgi:hypothetical protein
MPDKRYIPPRHRPSGLRESRLIVIAAEGTHTEKAYFEELAVAYYNPRVHVEVLDHPTTASAPEHILALLDGFRKAYKIRPDYDELWLVVDVDRWGEEKLSNISALCLQKMYQFAVSNPCFEIWLLLHLRALDEYDEATLAEFRLNQKINDRTRLDRELVNLLGGYNKSEPEIPRFLPHIDIAITRAQQLDLYPDQRWPNDLGSRVYLLATRIIARQR